MILAGIWHGASFNFIIWGGLHGVYLILERFGRKYLSSVQIPSLISRIFVYFVVTITWIPFFMKDYSDTKFLFFQLFSDNFGSLSYNVKNLLLKASLILVIGIIWSFILGEQFFNVWSGSDQIIKKRAKMILFPILYSLLFIFSLAFSLINVQVPFIYFQF